MKFEFRLASQPLCCHISFVTIRILLIRISVKYMENEHLVANILVKKKTKLFLIIYLTILPSCINYFEYENFSGLTYLWEFLTYLHALENSPF